MLESGIDFDDKVNKKVILDPKSSKYMKQAFEMYATGNYSYKEIEKILYNKGFRSKSGKKVSHALIHHSLINPFYYGIMERQGEFYKGNHNWKKIKSGLQFSKILEMV